MWPWPLWPHLGRMQTVGCIREVRTAQKKSYAMDKRIHFLDQLRSHMMLLGVVLHVAGNYNTMPAGELWPYKDADTYGVLSVLVTFIHSFRMQVFFLVAGFFAVLLMDARGVQGYLRNRSLRILAPLLLFVLPLTLACGWLFRQGADLMALRGVTVDFDAQWPLYHLWFLYYLFIYCLLALGLNGPVRTWMASAARARRAVLALPWLLVLALALVHGLKGSYLLDTPVDLHLVWGVFAQYGLFFLAGMVGYHGRAEFFASFASWKRWLVLTLAALIAFVASASWTAKANPENPLFHINALKSNRIKSAPRNHPECRIIIRQ